MDIRFQAHNTHLESPDRFEDLDPQLRELRRQPLAHRPRLLDRLPVREAGIYSIGGGRQVGKTTLLKLWMADLLRQGIPPERIAYFTGELIDDQHSLVRLATDHLDEVHSPGLQYLLLDEITYIRGWDKGVKYLADAGLLEDVVMILTGSDTVIFKEARMHFPGRRGRQDIVDFHLYPLSFAETVLLKRRLPDAALERLIAEDDDPPLGEVELLFEVFEEYLLHGGFLTAINDMARAGRILPATYNVYSNWIRGDVLKRGKQEHFLREILSALIRRAGSQVTWNNLVQDLSIDHPKTVADYVSLLASMDVVLIQAALIEDKLVGAPKKPRKLMFADPFIHHAVRSWLHPVKDPFQDQVKPALDDTDRHSHLVEACATSHIWRMAPTFYIKAMGEVDIAYVKGDTFWPLEIKWSRQLRPKDLKQIAKYRNGRIWSRSRRRGELRGVPVEPLPVALLRLGLETGTGGQGSQPREGSLT